MEQMEHHLSLCRPPTWPTSHPGFNPNLTPQSHGPSPSTSNPPPAASRPPNPQQPLVSRDAKLVLDNGRSYSGRGLQLDPDQQLRLVKICRRAMTRCDPKAYPKSFWITIATSFEEATGRRYSWQSCRRRMIALVTKRLEFWAVFDECVRRKEYPDCDILDDVADEVDVWLECEKQVPQDCIEKKDEAYQVAEDQIWRKAHAREADKPNPQLTRTPEVPHGAKIQRVVNWVMGLPSLVEMDLLPLHWGESRMDFSRRSRVNADDDRLLLSQSQSQSRSRSPGRDATISYRQRSRSPQADRPAQAINPVMALNRIGQKFHAAAMNLHPPLQRRVNPTGADESSTTQSPLPVAPGVPQFAQPTNKRPRDDDDEANDRPARRLRQTPRSHPSETPVSDPTGLPQNHLKIVENSVDFAFGNFWGGLAPLFGDCDPRQQAQATKPESVMRDMLRDIATAITKAVLKMREADNAAA
ncbi:hypothetical protein P170DRAFT_440386 [Aspergillus steynii IBT 23096]|uniref:Uncharacterized protein n=1 Tax=Aspergillus steynii IBT 23096 TaxID=1392250 RepID=A0A2I2FXA5_9EURO|nr:uncharacterized protein P170DRAFT_440386 [Aspergillus steynii IBT 23096]PLB45242.1 hypothetical protein P170DRAFT_440386 [Aspergillus steynii IBT 23096]